MAGRLLLGILMVSALQACLLPQDGNVLPIVDGQNPPKKNRPPRILQETVDPAQVVRIPSSVFNCQSFKVGVTDPDGDVIQSLWFIDPNQTFTASTNNPLPLSGAVVSANPTGVLNSPFGLTGMTSQLLQLRSDKQPHTLTLVVSDGTFLSPGQPIYEQLPDGGQTCLSTSCSGIITAPHLSTTDGGVLPDGGPVIIIDPSYTDSFTWVVNPDSSLTSCPSGTSP